MDDVANHFNLTEEEREQTSPSGKQNEPYNSTYWASFDQLKAGLLEKRQLGIYAITGESSSNHDY